LPPPVKKHQELELTIENLAFGGIGIAHVDDYIIFIPKGAVPGQVVKARITKATSNYGEAKVLEIIRKSDNVIIPPCPYFGQCGGCKHQNLQYEEQLKQLHNQVKELYHHLGGFKETVVNSPVPSDKIFRYRNKMEFAFSNRRWLMDDFDEEKPEDFALGLRASGNYWKAIDIGDCIIAPEESGILLSSVRSFALKSKISAYDQKSHEGFLRHLVIRKGQKTDQLMLNIVTNSDSPELLMPLVDELSEKLPNLTCFVNIVNRGVSGTTTGEKTNLLYGKQYIEEKFGDLTFKISPSSFFQTNTLMAEKLYEVVKDFAKLKKSDIVWDLYCGTGTIALYLASCVKRVIGFEIVHEAIKDANENARLNGIENIRFIEGNLDKLFRKEPELLKELPYPDLIIIDPPRSGMHPKLVNDIIKIHPRKIVYVSCNPATQVRDLKLIVDEGNYRIDSVQPVDMFPHTPHIEVVVKLVLKC